MQETKLNRASHSAADKGICRPATPEGKGLCANINTSAEWCNIMSFIGLEVPTDGGHTDRVRCCWSDGAWSSDSTDFAATGCSGRRCIRKIHQRWERAGQAGRAIASRWRPCEGFHWHCLAGSALVAPGPEVGRIQSDARSKTVGRDC